MNAIQPLIARGPTFEELRRVPFFAALPPEALAVLGQHMRARSFEPGEFVFWEGEPSRGFWFLVEGQVRLSKLSSDGREQVLCTARGHTCLGCPILSGGTYMASAQALTPVLAVLVPWQQVREVAARAPAAGLALLRMMAERHRMLGQVASTLALRCVAARICRTLLEEEQQADSSTLHLTHEEIAALAGTAREVVTRLLNDLQRRGVVEMGRRTIIIKDRAALQRISQSA